MVKSKSNKLPVASTASPMPASDKDYKESERKYKAEDGLRAIERAEEFKRDKECMKDIKALAKQKIKDLGKIGKK